MLKQKLEELGFKFSDTYGASSGYLMGDGSFLNLQFQEPLNTRDRVYHAMLDRYIQRNNLVENVDQYRKVGNKRRPRFLAPGNDRILRYTDNACTINDGSAFICEGVFCDLPPEMPKGKQLEQLTLWIDYLHYRTNVNKRHLDVSLEDEVRHFDLNSDSTDDIIKEIRKLYNTTDERKE